MMMIIKVLKITERNRENGDNRYLYFMQMNILIIFTMT